MNKNYFPTLGAALESVREYLAEMRAVCPEQDSFFDHFAMGGVSYGQTKSRAEMLSEYKGKPCRNKAVSLSVYRMESGTYEAVAYIA